MQYLDHKKHPERFGASVYTPTWEDWEKGQGHYGNYRAVQVPDEIPQVGEDIFAATNKFCRRGWRQPHG